MSGIFLATIMPLPILKFAGEVAERFKAAVLKTVE
jgi:hypothetical protein